MKPIFTYNYVTCCSVNGRGNRGVPPGFFERHEVTCSACAYCARPFVSGEAWAGREDGVVCPDCERSGKHRCRCGHERQEHDEYGCKAIIMTKHSPTGQKLCTCLEFKERT